MQEKILMGRATSFHRELAFPTGPKLNVVNIKIQNPATFAKLSAIKSSPRVIASNRKLGPTVLAVDETNQQHFCNRQAKKTSRYEILVYML